MPQEENKEKTVRLGKSLEENVRLIKHAFDDTETLITRYFENRHNPGIRCCILFTDGMVSNMLINQYIMTPVLDFENQVATSCAIQFLMDKVLEINEVKKTAEWKDISEAIVYGDTVLLAQGCDEALVLNTKGWPLRSVSEPDGEKVLSGPREGFTEGLLTNLAMLRRKVKTTDLNFKFRAFGRETKTKACVCWIGRLAKPEVLEELERRLDRFDMDGALDTNYLAEFIKDSPYSVFKTVGFTERPDVVAAKLLEGRVAVFLDGTPMVLTAPYLFIENFQSNEDYYVNYWQASVYRLLRVVAFFLTTVTPAFYIAAVTAQQELLPTPLVLSISVARSGVPFPTILETILMLFMFDVLRETGIRVSSNVGQALSIVGALVVGQAAVEARIASAPVIIVVAVSGITSLIIPRLTFALIAIRSALLLLAFVLGMFGIVIGLMGLLIYLVGLRSFGLPAFHNPSFKTQRHIDTVVRAPWWMMETRPTGMSQDKKRRAGKGREQP